ncbi:MAG: chromate efflux transporter [Deltaproteobacteria bacterium]
MRYFVWLGTVGFGGPVVLVERMRRDLSEERRWYTTTEYKEGLALAQLAPGPLAAQLAIYLGWVRAGVAGATVVGAAFIGPSFAMVLALSAAYVRYGGLPWMRGAFYGIGAAVIAIIAHSAYRLVKRTVGADRLLWSLVALNAFLTAWTERELVWVILASGMLVVLWRKVPHGPTAAAAVAIPPWLLTGIHGAAPGRALAGIAGYFAKAGAVVFGSGLAIVPFLHGGVVQQMHWLDERQFLDAVAVSMITPGPVVITVAFVGYLVAGPLGACAAAVGVFLPVYVVVVFVARWFHRLAANRPLRAAIDGVTAAATGAIAGAVVVLGRRALTDVPTWTIFAVSAGLVLFAKKVAEPILILAAGVAGVVLQAFAT